MSQEDYQAGVEWLGRVAPDHKLLGALRRKYSKINTMYLERILSKLGERPTARIKRLEAEPELDVNLLDPEYVALQRRISNLFGLRRKLSNSFHDCSTDEERASVSIEIGHIQSKIGRALKSRRYFQRNGEFPMIEEEEEEPLPSGVQLMRAYNANSRRRSYTKTEIQKLIGTKDPRKQRRLKDLEEKLKTDEREFERLSAALQAEAI